MVAKRYKKTPLRLSKDEDDNVEGTTFTLKAEDSDVDADNHL